MNALMIPLAIICYVGLLILLIRFLKRPLAALKKRLGFDDKGYYPSFWTIAVIGYFIFTAVGMGALAAMQGGWDFRIGETVGVLLVNLLFSFLYTYIYFLPYLIAHKKNHLQTRAIYILNIFAGWTVLIWFVALIWACTNTQSTTIIREAAVSSADELAKFKVLLDSGVITQEEFDQKKQQILNH